MIAAGTPDDICAYCRWPIDFDMGEGLDTAIEMHGKWMHEVCADHYRGWPT